MYNKQEKKNKKIRHDLIHNNQGKNDVKQCNYDYNSEVLRDTKL